MKKTSTEAQLITYLHTKGHKLGMPVSGTFELTARCNKAARDRGMVFVLLTGGEPFVRKDFFEIYDGMRKLGLIVSINSNGSMLRG